MGATYVLVVLAKGAKKSPHYYLDIDEEVKERINQAIQSSRLVPAVSSTLWAFGAGTDEQHRYGPTLATLMAKHLQERNPLVKDILVNAHGRHYYGTFEEIEWVVTEVARMFEPSTETRFVFYTQRRHMRRVRLIWRLFYQQQWGEAELVKTGQWKEIPWSHEVKATLKVFAIYFGFKKPRSATPYPFIPGPGCGSGCE